MIGIDTESGQSVSVYCVWLFCPVSLQIPVSSLNVLFWFRFITNMDIYGNWEIMFIGTSTFLSCIVFLPSHFNKFLFILDVIIIPMVFNPNPNSSLIIIPIFSAIVAVLAATYSQNIGLFDWIHSIAAVDSNAEGIELCLLPFRLFFVSHDMHWFLTAHSIEHNRNWIKSYWGRGIFSICHERNCSNRWREANQTQFRALWLLRVVLINFVMPIHVIFARPNKSPEVLIGSFFLIILISAVCSVDMSIWEDNQYVSCVWIRALVIPVWCCKYTDLQELKAHLVDRCHLLVLLFWWEYLQDPQLMVENYVVDTTLSQSISWHSQSVNF